jgi:hypothetical protein
VDCLEDEELCEEFTVFETPTIKIFTVVSVGNFIVPFSVKIIILDFLIIKSPFLVEIKNTDFDVDIIII